MSTGTPCQNLQVSYYVDGVQLDHQIVCVLAYPYTCNTGTTTSATGGLDGSVAHVVLYETALTEAQIVDIADTTECQGDVTPPTVEICLSCNNPADPTRANIGDTISVVLTSDEPITVPTVTCNGAVVDLTAAQTTDTNWVGSFVVVQDATSTGDVVCVITATDAAGNSDTTTINSNNAGSDCWVFVDPFSVLATYCVMSDNPNSDMIVEPNDHLVVNFNFNTTVLEPTIVCNGAMFTATPGLG
jgi:hypothetical protein